MSFFCHKHGHSYFYLHQRRAEGSDPFLWAEGVPGVKMHGMMSVQCGNSVMSQQIVNGARGSKMVAQALSMGKELDANPHPLLMQTPPTLLKNLKKLNFEVLEHPLYSLDLTSSDSPVWSTAFVFLNMKHTVRIIIDSPSCVCMCVCVCIYIYIYIYIYIHTHTYIHFV
jgi:hypothetical protein